MEIKIFGTPGEIAALATKLQERQRVQGFEIKSPYCGRDENGNLLVIHCASGANNVVITGTSGFVSAARPDYYGE